MKSLAAISVVGFLAGGAAVAEELNRFEISVETGKPSILSGPEVKQISNSVARFGFYPGKQFQLTLTYTKWDGLLADDDSLGVEFSDDFNRDITPPKPGTPEDCVPRPKCYQVNFRNAVLDDRTIKFEQIEVGVVKTIPIKEKHWEAFVGLGIGVQKSEGDFSWEGFIPPVNNPTLKPALDETQTSEFLTTVRGGARYAFYDWFALEGNFKWIPIAKMFGNEYNGLELNAGLVFRFGKF